MGLLQIQADFQPSSIKRVHMAPTNKKLLLLDMDETLLHAATIEDIYVNQVYGQDAQPSFVTHFFDNDI